jgi:xylan 1,4-beta-xylosidase
MVYRAVKKVHDQIVSSPLPRLPLIFSEYGASYSNEPNVTDSPFMGPWLANTIRQCDGIVDDMAYWTFSDVFEEQGVARTSFYGGFGVIAPNSVPKASFNALSILHKLGDRRIAVDSDSVLATKLPDGSIAIALWNYAPPGGEGPNYTPPSKLPGASQTFVVQLDHFNANSATLYRVDSEHASSLALFDSMGRPDDLSADQIAELQKAGSLGPPESATIQGERLTTTIPPYGLEVLLIKKR